MKKKKLVYIISNIDKALAFEWIAEAAKLRNVCEIHFILLNEQEGHLYRYLRESNHSVDWILYRGKKDLLATIWHLYRYLHSEKPEIVHTHLFDAGLTGLLAAKLAGVPKRVYTRHHATMHHTYYPRAVYYDRFINSLATHVVAISENVKRVLLEMEGVPSEKVVLIHHGFDLNLFSKVPEERVGSIYKRHQLDSNAGPIVGVISRYIHLKGIEYIIEAFARIREQYPAAHLVLANARGDYKQAIQEKLRLLPQTSYTEIAFENDLPALYKVFDIYIHTPIDEHSEAFGQTYVEALAAGVPSVFTLSGVAAEFIKDRAHAVVVPFKDAQAIAAACIELLADPALRQTLEVNGYAAVAPAFTVEAMVSKLVALYAS